MTLTEQIQLGESKILEFKRKLPTNADIAKTAIAFSNTAGGKLLIGVDDRGEIKGVDESKLLALKLIKPHANTLYPTNALLILLGKFEHCTLKCARFKGTTMDVFIDK